MRRLAVFAATIVALLALHSMEVTRIDAEGPSETATATPQYEYHVVSGLRYAPAVPDEDVRISDGWHYNSLDITIPTTASGRPAEGKPILADIRRISGEMLTASLAEYESETSKCTGKSVEIRVGATVENGTLDRPGRVVAIVSYVHVSEVPLTTTDGRVIAWNVGSGHAPREMGNVLSNEVPACLRAQQWDAPHLHQNVAIPKLSPASLETDATVGLKGQAPYSGVSSGWPCVAPDRPFWRIVAPTRTLPPFGPADAVVATTGCHILNIRVTGDGTVTPNPVAIPAYGGVYDTGTVATLTATPDPFNRFVRWDGAGVTGEAAEVNPISVAMTKDWTVKAVFAADPYAPPAGLALSLDADNRSRLALTFTPNPTASTTQFELYRATTFRVQRDRLLRPGLGLLRRRAYEARWNVTRLVRRAVEGLQVPSARAELRQRRRPPAGFRLPRVQTVDRDLRHVMDRLHGLGLRAATAAAPDAATAYRPRLPRPQCVQRAHLLAPRLRVHHRGRPPQHSGRRRRLWDLALAGSGVGEVLPVERRHGRGRIGELHDRCGQHPLDPGVQHIPRRRDHPPWPAAEAAPVVAADSQRCDPSPTTSPRRSGPSSTPS